MRVVLLAAILFAATLSTGGCKKGGGNASCDAVGARFHAIADADLAADKGVDARERAAIRGLIGPMRDALVKSCRDNNWSPDARACMAAAADEGAFRACEVKLTGEQRAMLEQAAAKGIQAK